MDYHHLLNIADFFEELWDSNPNNALPLVLNLGFERINAHLHHQILFIVVIGRHCDVYRNRTHLVTFRVCRSTDELIHQNGDL